MTVLKGTSVVLVLFCLMGALAPVEAQETRGTILGRVTDPTTAVIVSAAVEALNANTGVRATTTTNASGDYILPFLIPGSYVLTVEAPGFKRFVRSGINVRVNDRITIDAPLELGETAETVQVIAESPLLDTSTASMGQVIDSKAILELPLKDGMVLLMASFTPGVLFQPQSPGYVRPFDTSSPSRLSVDGSRIGTNEFLLDGAPNMHRGEIAYSPPPGVVEQFKVQTATFDAAFGHNTGAAMNMSLKSGTNELHGQVYYFHQNPVLNANRFFLNRIGAEKLDFRIHRWGGNVSGPVRLGDLYDGRNKTFWMYGYEGIWSFDPSPFYVENVPLPAQREGDFSQLLALGSQYQIYDPYSIAAAPNGRFSRSPLPNNLIPQSQISPVARNIAELWDLPNQQGTADGEDNFQIGKNAQDSYYNHIVRIDHNLSERQRFYGRGYVTKMDRPENQRYNGAMGDRFQRYNRGLGFDHVYTASATFIVNTRYSFARFINAFEPFQTGWDLASLGFASSYIQRIDAVDARALRLPRIDIDGNPSLSTQSLNKRHNNTHEIASNFTSIINAHTLRFGVGYRVLMENTFNLSNSSGLLDFDTNWTRGPLDNSASAPIGQGFASFMYGLPTGGNFPITDSFAERTSTFSLFVQDDWKFSPKLTISLGLRYELTAPLTERFNRSVRGFDFESPNPIEAEARVNYANNPIPELPVDQFQATGGLLFAGAGGQPRGLWNTPRKNFMPRIGLAYQITPKTVFRTGYGIYFEAIGVVSDHVSQTGFSRTTTLVPSLDNGLSFAGTLENPFPDGFLQPLGSAGGLVTNLGQGVTFFNENLRHPYAQRWQMALQRELPGTAVLEVSYVGNRATRLFAGRNLDPTPREYLSTSTVRDNVTNSFLTEQVANPFYPLLPGTSLSGNRVQRQQLLRPYPHFTQVSTDTNEGYSWYHSMQIRFEKRLSHGLMSSVSYTWSKLMEANSFLNPTDPRPEEVISASDRTNRLAWTWIYELPFGRGRRFGSGWGGAADKILGGWQIQGIYTLQSGIPLGFGNAIFNGDLKDIRLPAGERTVDRYFNTDAGFVRQANQQLVTATSIRTFPSRFTGIRGPGQNNWDLSVIKNAQLSEGVQLQIRAEAINALNHAQFNNPNTSVTSTSFGRITTEWAWPRVVQLGMKILF